MGGVEGHLVCVRGLGSNPHSDCELGAHDCELGAH